MDYKILKDGNYLERHLFSLYRWMREKMDGIRAYWDGEKLFSKRGKQLRSPAWFLKGFPIGVKLDGELWIGRGAFEKLMANLSSYGDHRWQDVNYFIFDLINDMDFEERMEELAKLQLPNHVRLVSHRKCAGNQNLIAYLNDIVQSGGEGISIIKPHSKYLAQRSNTVLEVKVFYPWKESYLF